MRKRSSFIDQIQYEERQATDTNPTHFVSTRRPSLHERKSSGNNLYAPNRKPSRNEHLGQNGIESDSALPHRPTVLHRTSTRSSAAGRAAFHDQERAYVQKLKQEPENDYYEAGLAKYQLDDDDEDDDNDDLDYAYGFANIDVQNDLTSFDASQEDDTSSPANRERLEWLTMLASVLTGEVVQSEKKRISGTVGTTDQGKIMSEIWVGLQARAVGRSLGDQKRIIEDARVAMDSALESVKRFQIRGKDKTTLSPPEQVAEILQQLDHCEGMYPSRADMEAAKPIVGSTQFQQNVAALNAWTTVTSSIHTALGVLKRWTGNEELDVTQPHKVDLDNKTLPGMNDESSFIERVLKENGLQRTFEKKSLSNIASLVSRAKSTMIQHSQTFAAMHLPPYLDELLLIINFPTKLIEEALKLRLVYARRLEDPTMLMVDQMFEDFVTLLNLAVEIKEQYIKVTTPQEGWNLPPCIDENFDSVVLDTLEFYFKLLNWKLGSNSRGNYFKEAEILESEYEFLDKISKLVEGGDVHVAEQFSALTHKLMTRVFTDFQSQLSGPKSKTAAEMQKHYSANFENVRLRHRKLLRFSKSLSSRFENSTEYSIATQQDWNELISNLVETGHFFAYTASVEHDGVYIIADPSLLDRQDTIRSILRTCAPQDTNATEEPSPLSSYVLIMCPPQALSWPGRVIEVNVSDPNLDLKTGRIRLVADGSRERLRNANLNFSTISGGLVNMVIPQRANLTRVNRELMKINKVSYRLSNAILDSVQVIREKVRDYECEDLVQNTFSFATEFGQRALRYMDSSRRAQNSLKLIHLGVEWVSFICDDCDPTDRKTFKWTVIALEFAMMMIRGRNVLVIGDEVFTRLRAKVARCMTLLISHFDIMGARSAAQLERERLENTRNRKNTLYDQDGLPADQDMLKTMKKDLLSKLDELENHRKAHQEELQLAGKVLDDTISENRSLMYLASSLSNITMRWQQGRFIGGGSFGNVYQGVNLDTGEVMAVKEIRLQDPQSIGGIVKSIKDEMTVLEMLNHPNIVSYYGVEVHRDKVYIFMELCQGGSLAAQLEHGRIAEETVIQVYTLQMLEGLAHLHERGIVHRDIKPENVLLDHNGIIKFVDFGAAKVIAKRGQTKAAAKTQVNSMTGTPMYMSPEIITGSDKGRQGAMDIWSLGCCVIEMATAQRPWSNLDNEWAIMYHIAGLHAPAFPTYEQLSSSGQEFLERCFDRDPNTRASAVELLNDPWMLDIKQNTGMTVSSPATPSSSDYSYGNSSPLGSSNTSTTNSIRYNGNAGTYSK
ncbi:MAP kinase kinase kinase wis4 [Taphrina deformans PYCC 5710]|uniref:MAP kinase kinase kinase wis4 n=1 Tax=Taphrina deformans (strain PYCC 5710 / ATCC 11124 / CBS 356.35 / IMI 108563 / JCM 9778 / NBRC 8474) TaxID=1097556 RepID=R4XCX0_TAPDE|nr:MAP kinase kinase kinase wis4 [Taphrina deformans PYCC 5710]|eukprot:CCG82258.1 MAP kinase kinase kinase wis4 [Taphrina deformans PYCC 5710]